MVRRKSDNGFMCLYDKPYFRFLLFQVKIEERDRLEIVKKSITKNQFYQKVYCLNGTIICNI